MARPNGDADVVRPTINQPTNELQRSPATFSSREHQQEREQLQQNNELSLYVEAVLRKCTLLHLARQAMQLANHQGSLTKADATAY